MTTAATSLLGLALPVTGELSGTWGSTVNDSITSLLDTAVAGTTTLSTDADVTLTTTTLASNQARQAILLCSGARTALRTITAPAQSKIYTIINNTTGGYAVKLVGVGPTTGVTIPAGTTAQVAWNGSDFVDVSGYVNGNLTVNGTLTVNGVTTLKNNLLFSADATYNIGASGATRPNNIFVANNVTAGGQISSITSSSGINFLAQCAQSSGYATIRLYNDQNSSVRALEIDYYGTTSLSGLTGGPTGEQASIATTGAYPMILGTGNAARMWFSGTSTAIGIGRTPTSILDVYGTTPIVTVAASDNNSRAYSSYTAKSSGGAAVTTAVGSFGDGVQGSLYTVTNHPLTFATNNASAQMALTTAGALALSATAPYNYAGNYKLYIDSPTQDYQSITLNALNSGGGYNGTILWQGYYASTTTTHNAIAIRRYNVDDSNTANYRQYLDFQMRPAGVNQSLVTAMRLNNISGGTLTIGGNQGTNAYDSTLYAYKSVSNITNGNQENNAAAHFGSTETTSNASVFIGADQGTNLYGYIGVIRKGISYLPLLINPSGGYVGIGTGVAMPAYNLDILGSSPGIRVKATASAGGAQLLLDCGSSSGYSNQIVFANTATSKWALGGKDVGSASGDQFSVYNYTVGNNAFTIDSATSQTSINTYSIGGMLYVNTAGYALTSAQTGAFLLVTGTGTGRPCIQVASTANGQDAAYRTVVTNGSTWSGWTVGVNIETGSDIMSWCYNSSGGARIYGASGTVGMRLSTGGALSTTTGSLGTISDIRMKKNVANATNKLDQLMQLRVVNYTLIDDPQERKMLGFVAQEVEQIFPGLVEEYDVRDPETKELVMMQKTVKTTVLIPMLVKAMQELKAEFDAYKASHP